jgi:hypothetical protein
VLLGLRANLEREELVEKVGVRDVTLGRLLEESGQLRFKPMEPETLTVAAQAIEERGAHRSPPMPLSVS